MSIEGRALAFFSRFFFSNYLLASFSMSSFQTNVGDRAELFMLNFFCKDGGTRHAASIEGSKNDIFLA